ncbi:MAG: EamA family transporter [Dehalococcoidia bacterium]
MRPSPVTPPSPSQGQRTLAGILLTFLAVLSLASAFFIANELAGTVAGGMTIALLEAAFGVVFISGLWLGSLAKLAGQSRSKRSWNTTDLGWLILAAVGAAAAMGGFYSALVHEDLSVVSPITGATPLVSFLLILVLLRGQERLTPRVILGGILVVTGVVLVGLAN